MRLFRCGLIILAAVLLVTLFSGCSDSKPTETTTPAEVVNEPEYAGAMTEEILQALNAGDFAAYTKNFDEAMKKVAQEIVFTQTRDLIQKKIGNYISKEAVTLQKSDAYTTVIYKAKFSDEPGDVTISVAFIETEDKVVVSGLWLDSPKLREQ